MKKWNEADWVAWVVMSMGLALFLSLTLTRTALGLDFCIADLLPGEFARSQCEVPESGLPCTCDGAVSGGTCPSADCVNDCVPAPLLSNPIYENFVGIQNCALVLDQMDADTNTAGALTYYTGTGSNRAASTGCTNASGQLVCTSAITASNNSSSAAGLAAVQLGTGPAVTVVGGEVRINDTPSTGGELHLYEGSNNGSDKVILASPANLSNSNTITFTAAGLIPVSAVDLAVQGPASATDNLVCRFDGGTGKLIQTSNMTMGDSGNTTLTVNSASTGLAISQAGAGLIFTALNGSSEGFGVDANGVSAASLSDATNPALLVTQAGAGPVATFTDTVGGGNTKVLNGGGLTITNDSGSNQPALAVEQDHASANIVTLLNGTDGVTLENDGTIIHNGTDNSVHTFQTYNNGTGPIAYLGDSDFDGLEVKAGGNVGIISDGNTPALKVEQDHATAAIAELKDGSDGVTIGNDGQTTIAVNSSSAALSITQDGTGELFSAIDVDSGVNSLTIDKDGSASFIATSNFAAMTVQQRTTGSQVLRLTTVTDGSDPSYICTQNRVQTTDANATTLLTIADLDQNVCYVEAKLVAVCVGGAGCTANDDGGSGFSTASFHAPSATGALIGTQTDVHKQFSEAGYAISFAASGDDLLVQVTGEANDTVTWKGMVCYTCIAN